MKILKYILFIPVIYTLIALLFMIIPYSFEAILSFDDTTLLIVMILFGGSLVGMFYYLPGLIIYLVNKLAPSITFGFYSSLTITLFLGFYNIFIFWTKIDSSDALELGLYIKFVLTCLSFGFISSIIISLCLNAEDYLSAKYEFFVSILMIVGGKIFGFGIFLIFCFLSLQLCDININKEYSWYSGIWHGIFVVPKWVFSFFIDAPIIFKARNSSIGYSIFWWIFLIFFSFSFLLPSRRNN